MGRRTARTSIGGLTSSSFGTTYGSSCMYDINSYQKYMREILKKYGNEDKYEKEVKRFVKQFKSLFLNKDVKRDRIYYKRRSEIAEFQLKKFKTKKLAKEYIDKKFKKEIILMKLTGDE